MQQRVYQELRVSQFVGYFYFGATNTERRDKNEKRKKMQKLFLFYVNINYRIFHVYNNLLLATSGVVDVAVVEDKFAVPFSASFNDVASFSETAANVVTAFC